MPTFARTHASGFTLLEILVAVGIFALFSAMAYGSLMRILDTRDRLELERDFWRGLTLSLMQIEEDLAQARPRNVRNPNGLSDPRPAFLGQPVDSRALGDASMEFTRGGQLVLGDGARSDMQRIGYRLRDGNLVKLIWPALDQAPASEPREVPLLDHVQELRVRFYAPAGGWVDYWPQNPPDPNNLLPSAVEMTLTLEGRGEFQRIFRVKG